MSFFRIAERLAWEAKKSSTRMSTTPMAEKSKICFVVTGWESGNGKAEKKTHSNRIRKMKTIKIRKTVNGFYVAIEIAVLPFCLLSLLFAVHKTVLCGSCVCVLIQELVTWNKVQIFTASAKKKMPYTTNLKHWNRKQQPEEKKGSDTKIFRNDFHVMGTVHHKNPYLS